MKAPARDQQLLLEVQQLDRKLAKNAHMRATMPQLAQIEQAKEQRSKLERARISAQTKTSDLQRQAKRLQADVQLVVDREQVQQRRLDEGLGSPRELQALSAELSQIARRRSKLEDEQLALEQQQQELAQICDKIADKTRRTDEQLQDLERQVGEEGRRAAAEAERLGEKRIQLAAQIDGDLMAAYEDVRASTGGIGAVAVRGRSVEGFPLQLSAAEWAQVDAAAPDDVVFCEEYGYILVREAAG